jgi:hypothetical protein
MDLNALGKERVEKGGIMRRRKILFSAVLVTILAGSLVYAQGIVQPMQGQVNRAGSPGEDIWTCGTFAAPTPDDCQLHYEYWSDVFSGEVNNGPGCPGTQCMVDGIPVYVLRGNPPGSLRGDYRADQANIGDFEIAGKTAGENWYLSWFGEFNSGAVDHLGYYAAQSQIVDFGEFGDSRFFNCLGDLPLACFTPPGPPNSPVPAGHSVTAPDGTVIPPIGGFSPIPIPNAELDIPNLLVNLSWDAATGVTMNDGAPDPIAGYRIWVAEDTDNDQNFPPPNTAQYRELADVPAGATSTQVSIPSEIDPAAEGVWFAIQLLYQSTESGFDAFERRSGYTLPNGDRVEGLSANGNLLDLGVLQIVKDFAGVTGLGNRVDLSWVINPPVETIESFEILVGKSVAGIDAGNLPPQFEENIIGPIPYDPAQILYSAVDDNAGRTGSKINVYILRVNFTNGNSLTSQPIVVFHKDKQQ